jgi:phenylpyruvate tautomerase PptA (4-oxalocrotonate tautomerase family)
MPLVRIDIGSDARVGLANEVGEIVYRAMIEEINVPEDDRFQILTSHESNRLVYPKSYLGIEYSAGIVFIQITLNQGRSTELKKRFYQRIASDCANQLGLRQQDIFINLIEVSKENWSFGNGEMQYGPTS